MSGSNVFVYPCDSFAGRAVAQAFADARCSVSGAVSSSQQAPSCVSASYKVGDPGGPAALRGMLLTADVVVYDLPGNEREAREALVQLAQQPFGGKELVFIGISSPLTWAASPPAANAGAAPASFSAAPHPLAFGLGGGDASVPATPTMGTRGGSVSMPAASGASFPGASGGSFLGGGPPAASGGSFLGGGGPLASGGSVTAGSGTAPMSPWGGAVLASDTLALPMMMGAPAELMPYTAEDFQHRLPAAPARATASVEHLVLRGSRKGRLRCYCVCPGLLYGMGEHDRIFFPSFKAAWEFQPPPVYGPGDNILPTLHVRDLGSYVVALAACRPDASGPSGGYRLVSDGSRCTQREVAEAIAAAFALAPPPGGRRPPSQPPQPGTEAAPGEEPPPPSAASLPPTPGCEALLLNLVFATTPLPPSAGWAPAAPPGGLPANAALAAAEFKTCRNVAPLRLLLMGPPCSGKTLLARRLAQQYRLAYISAPMLVAAATAAAATLPSSAEGRKRSETGDTRKSDTGGPGSPGAGGAGAPPGLPDGDGPIQIRVDPELARAALAEMQQALAAAQAAAAAVAKAAKGGKADASHGDHDPFAPPPRGLLSAKTMGELLASAVSDPWVASRGFVLDGLPRSMGQARGALCALAPDPNAPPPTPPLSTTPTPGAKGGGGGGGSAAAAKAAAAKAAKEEASAVPPGPDTFEVAGGMRLVPHPLTCPTHVVELAVPEQDLRLRLATLEAAERAAFDAAQAATEAAEAAAAAAAAAAATASGAKAKPPAKPLKGKGAQEAPAGPNTHNNEHGFRRRMDAYAAWRAEDAADREARVLAAQAAWRAAQEAAAEARAAAAAEAATLKAKRRRARALAAAATAGGGEGGSPDASLGTALDVTLAGGLAGGADDAAAPTPSAEGPKLPDHGGLIGTCLDGGAQHLRLPNPTLEAGPLLLPAPAPTAPGAPAPYVPPLPEVEARLAVFLGGPHNFQGFPAPPPEVDPAEAAAAQAAEAARAQAEADKAARVQAAAGRCAAAGESAAAARERAYALRAAVGGAAGGGRGSSPVRRYLMQRVMPAVSAALGELSAGYVDGGAPAAQEPAAAVGMGGLLPPEPESPLVRLARALYAAAEVEEARYVDPYTDQSYAVQLAKIEAKAQREAARAAAAAAKAEREAAARQEAAAAAAAAQQQPAE